MHRLRFSKTGDAIWLSHLDTARLLQRGFSRAGLQLKYSQGFSPKPQLAVALPLSVGIESQCELLDFELAENAVPPENAAELLNTVLPSGFRVREIYESDRKFKEIGFLQTKIVLEYDAGIPGFAKSELEKLFSGGNLTVEKFSKKGPVETDISPMIKRLSVREGIEGELELHCVLAAQEPSLNPMLLTAAIERYIPDLKPDFARYGRIEVLDRAGEQFR